jgi:hypothetical protein
MSKKFLTHLFCFTFAASALSAATLTVTNTNDSGAGSLRTAMSSAAAGDNILFDVSGTITLLSPLPLITSDLSINGSGQTITIDGNNTPGVRPFTVVAGTVEIKTFR